MPLGHVVADHATDAARALLAVYPGRVPQDRAAATARAAEEGLAASAKQLLAEAAAEALRAQVCLAKSCFKNKGS